MSRSIKSMRWHQLAVSAMLMAVAAGAQAQIMFIPGTAFVQADIAISATGGVGGVLTPAALVLPTQLIEVDDGPAIGGVKVSNMDLVYNGVAADFNKTFTVTWIVARPFTSLAPTAITHVNRLDGSVTYTAGFTLQDISLRTITTATDTDLTTLHLGGLASGTSFNQSLINAGYVQPAGNDRVLQYFSLRFLQNAATANTIELLLPGSASSTVAAVPEPASWVSLAVGLMALTFSAVLRSKVRSTPTLRESIPASAHLQMR